MSSRENNNEHQECSCWGRGNRSAKKNMNGHKAEQWKEVPPNDVISPTVLVACDVSSQMSHLSQNDAQEVFGQTR